jgi:hypothetical protein
MEYLNYALRLIDKDDIKTYAPEQFPEKHRCKNNRHEYSIEVRGTSLGSPTYGNEFSESGEESGHSKSRKRKTGMKKY